MLGIKRLLLIKRNEISVSRLIEALRVRLLFLPELIIWYLPFGFNKRNRYKLKQLNNIHKGKRCFIIASGPSLKHIDFKLLENELTFGMNRAYMMKDQVGFTPSYLCCIDIKTQLLQFKEEYDKIDYLPTFYNWDTKKYFKEMDERYFVKTKFSPAFLYKFPGFFGNGKSVTYTCIQLAFIMGFSEVYIIGKDHSYNVKEKVGLLEKSIGDDGNHFLKGYYNKGQYFAAPDYAGEEFAYRIAREAYEKNNRIIKDATIGGKLDVFEKVDFYSLFPTKKV